MIHIKISILLVVVALLTTTTAYGQSQRFSVEGIVLDTAQQPVPGVSVRLSSVVDTIVTATDERGRFVFQRVIARDFRLTYSVLGYQILHRSYRADNSNQHLNILPVMVYPQQTLIGEVQITRIKPIVIKGDTIQYNLEAYDIAKNTLLEGALKILPNVQVLRDGTVVVSGKQVSRVQVDGKNFFGGDVLTATRNLHAEIIKSVQVIDYYGDVSDATGIKSGEPEKIINIVLHDDKKKILFGQVTAGGGSKDRYIGSVGVNNFNDGQELSIVASTNNTNTSLFSYGSPTGAGGRDRDMIDLTGMMDPVDGVNKVNSVGLSFSDQLSDRVELYGKYAFTERRNNTHSDMHLKSGFEHYLIENLETKETTYNQRSHTMSWDLEAQINERNYLKISPNLSYSVNDQVSNSIKTLRNREVSSEGEYSVDGQSNTPAVGTDMIYVRSFKRPGRKLVVNGNFEYSDTDRSERIGDYFVSIDSAYLQPRIDIYSMLQQSDNAHASRVGKVRAAYVEPIHKKGILEFSYEYDYTSIRSSRSVWDIEEAHVIDSLGVQYNYLFMSNRYGLTYQVEQGSKLKYTFGLAAQPLVLEGHSPDHQVRTRYSQVNWLPSANLRYRLSEESEWSVDYMGTNNQPGYVQMQPVRDLSNSQNIIVGNADLKAEFINKISTRYRRTQFSNNRFFEGQASFNHVRNKIVSNRKPISGTTAMETSFLNAQGYYDIRAYYMFSSMLGLDMFQLNLNGTGDYINNISFTNDRLNESNHFIYSQGAQLRYSLEDLVEMEVNSAYTLNSSRSSVGSLGVTHAHSFLVGLAGKSYLSDDLSLGFDISHRANMGYSNYVNSNPTLLNAYVEYTFMRNKMALIRLHGFDVFNQNTGVTREVYDTMDLSVRNNRLGRYFMLSLNIRLQRLPGSN